MSADLELCVLSQVREGRGYVAGFAVTDLMIVALGGVSSEPIVMVSSNARDFVERKTPRELGLRDAIAIADAVWACGEYGQLAVSRDHGGSWSLLETGTTACLFGLTLGADGALWVVGDQGYAARVLGPRVQPVDLGTTTRLTAVHAVRDEIVALGFDGQLRRWRAGKVVTVPCGATKPLTDLAITDKGTWVVIGDGGFIARSPDGQWYSRAGAGVEADLEAICALPDGALVAVGDRGLILRSEDDGRTWSELPHPAGAGHLWSIERFGDGVLIGGDGGLVVRLAPPDDAAWGDRPDDFAVLPLDDVFAAGPEGFIEHGLDAYLAAIAPEQEHGPAGEPAAGEPRHEDPAGEIEGAGEDDAVALLRRPGDADSFRDSYGVPLPPEAKAFFDKVAGHRPWDTFEELRLDARLLPDVGEHNLFELMVRRNQRAYLGTDLVDAFCGVFHIGSLGNGDTYHLELYEWDGPRQVLHFDHETHSVSKIVADSLDSLVYLAALTKAGDEGKISQGWYAAGLHELHGKVSPTWHFEIDDKDARFVHLEPRRRDSEFFFYRSRWLTALLKHDGVTDMRDVPALFMADFNQVIAPDQIPARLQACERFIPTALYSMWRAYFFDEPELERYLETGRGHAARLVRDAARLIDELLAGRNELGTIGDVRAYLRALRELDLDPRRADQRRAEAQARTQAEAARKAQAAAELDATPAERWHDLAWRWIDDGLAHRALLERLDRTDRTDRTAPHAAQLAALEELCALPDDERAALLPRLAAELAPELEAVLVGSLVRDDRLEGVLARPGRHGGEGGEDRAPGWDAIDAALRPIYGAVEPIHYLAPVPYAIGGKDPIHGISAYERNTPVPHWHFVTYGFTDLFDKGTGDPEVSGFGFELTMRVAREPDEDTPPAWAPGFLQHLGRHVFRTRTRFALGHKLRLDAPIAPGQDTGITAICFAEDPELGELVSEHGKARFLQIVGITDDEYELIQRWSAAGLLEILGRRLPYLVTDLARGSVLADPEIAAEVELRVAQEGPSEQVPPAEEPRIELDDDDAADDDDDDDASPDAARVTRALGMTRRALRLSPDDADVQLTHAMLLLAGDRGGLPGAVDELLERLPRFAPPVRIRVAVLLGEHGHARFGDAVDIALGEALPEQIFAAGSAAVGGAVMISFGDVAHELFDELGEVILAHAPSKMARLVPLLPDDVDLISELAWKAIEANQRDCAIALYDRVLALPIPGEGQERVNYLRAMNNACIQAHAAKAYDAAVRIAERAQPVAHENPYIYHAAACAYAAVGDLDRAFEQVKLAVQHGYDHLSKVEVDADLGALLEWPEFKALFRDWRARQEGN